MSLPTASDVPGMLLFIFCHAPAPLFTLVSVLVFVFPCLCCPFVFSLVHFVVFILSKTLIQSVVSTSLLLFFSLSPSLFQSLSPPLSPFLSPKLSSSLFKSLSPPSTHFICSCLEPWFRPCLRPWYRPCLHQKCVKTQSYGTTQIQSYKSCFANFVRSSKKCYSFYFIVLIFTADS